MSRLGMLIQIAWRNLLASPINLIIGGLILAGTFLFVVVGGLLDSLNEAMARSVVGSVAGHIQIYSSKSKDELSLYGGMGGDPDLSAVTEFPRIKQVLEQIDNVKEVVPMGSSGALITAGNIVDITLEKLRNLYKARDGQFDDPRLKGLSKDEIETRIASTRRHVRQIIRVLEADQKKAQAILREQAVDAEVVAALERVSQDAFWDDFEKDTWGSLEFLENKIAPQVTDAQLMFLRYLGTDLDRFQTSFDRMQIIDGTPVPKGQRGFLIAKLFYEDQMKLKNARRLDKLRDAKAVGRLIANDDELKRFVKENRSQTRDIVLQFDDLKTAEATKKLQTALKSTEPDLIVLLSTFFDTTDDNFEERYQFFYKELAPMVDLYKVRVGDTLTIKAFSRGGAIQAVNVKVYGTFAFTGLEKSPLAGGTSLMDLMSFRDLYGYLTADKKEELAQLQKDTGARTISRENAEADLFGEGNTVVAEATAGVIDEEKTFTGVGRRLREDDLVKRVYTDAEINGGVVLNAAVTVKDPKRLQQTIDAINKASDDQKLEIKAISWQQASGILGQIITFFRGVLLLAVFFIFGIAMVIINNAMMMATLQRTQMIGTMRAIGAQRSLILTMVLAESVVLGVLFGGIGIALGSAVMSWLHTRGIPAPNDVAYFFFSGPKLLPDLNGGNLVVALVIILVVTLLSTLFPAVIATRVSPLRAMQSDE
ncbi:MAG: FtsX-like permease family protein [Archangiaceae bacterium]|nr:FtsX-like permease family protein [Archangiaceae bacterium]